MFDAPVTELKKTLLSGQASLEGWSSKDLVPKVLQPFWRAAREGRVRVEFHSLGVEVRVSNEKEGAEICEALSHSSFELVAFALWNSGLSADFKLNTRAQSIAFPTFGALMCKSKPFEEERAVRVCTFHASMFKRSFCAVANVLTSQARFFESALTEQRVIPSATVLFFSNWRSKIPGVNGGNDLDVNRVYSEQQDRDDLRARLGDWTVQGDGRLRPSGSVFLFTAICSENDWQHLEQVVSSSLRNVFQLSSSKAGKLDLSWAVDSQGLNNGADLLALMKRDESVTELDLSNNFLCWPDDKEVFETVARVYPNLSMLRLCRSTICKLEFASWLNDFAACGTRKVDLSSSTICQSSKLREPFLKLLTSTTKANTIM